MRLRNVADGLLIPAPKTGRVGLLVPASTGICCPFRGEPVEGSKGPELNFCLGAGHISSLCPGASEVSMDQCAPDMFGRA